MNNNSKLFGNQNQFPASIEDAYFFANVTLQSVFANLLAPAETSAEAKQIIEDYVEQHHWNQNANVQWHEWSNGGYGLQMDGFMVYNSVFENGFACEILYAFGLDITDNDYDLCINIYQISITC